jgi:hypothetical protein
MLPGDSAPAAGCFGHSMFLGAPQPSLSAAMPHPHPHPHVAPPTTVSPADTVGQYRSPPTSDASSALLPSSSSESRYYDYDYRHEPEAQGFEQHAWSSHDAAYLSGAVPAPPGAFLNSWSSTEFGPGYGFAYASSSSLAGAVPGIGVPIIGVLANVPRVPTPAPKPALPTVRCRILKPDGTLCSCAIPLRRADTENAVRAHIRAVHPAYLPRGKTELPCPWDGGRCQTRGAARVEDVPLHIFHTHLNLKHACDKCRSAQWASPFALERHRKKCRGQEPARCARCYWEFPSLAALNQHVAQGGCV